MAGPLEPQGANQYALSVSQERMLNDEFDELMRSGATMKVSLTPDRLKTMEVRFSFPDRITPPTQTLGVQGGEESSCWPQGLD